MRIYVVYIPYESVLLFGKGTTANFYSHLDYKSRISSAEVISNALGDEDDENEDKKKTAGS